MTMSSPPYDPRAIANLMLDEADRLGREISNLALQKLLYFAHGMFLSDVKKPLVSGYFEAWQYGPVHPAVYHEFKTAGDKPINFRATKRDILTGTRSGLPLPESQEVLRVIRFVMRSYWELTPGRLVEISHAKNAPWKYIVDRSRTNEAFGMRMPDEVILERFKFHKVFVGESPLPGEPREDSPFARD
jgi:uncharacterized phage-associated protein